MKIKALIATATFVAGVAISGLALAADPIEGLWKRPNGTKVKFSTCGGGFCATVASGKHSGKRAGKLTKKGKEYVGSLTDVSDGTKYTGKAWFSGKNLKMRGYSGIFFKTETWRR